MTEPLLRVEDLRVEFPVKTGILSRHRSGVLRAVSGVNLEIKPGETLGLVGESGCGKTTLGRAIVRLTESTSGRIIFEGTDITHLNGPALRERRRRLQMVFQDPYGSLDPRMTVLDIIGEALDIHGLAAGRATRKKSILSLLSAVGLDPAHATRYPHEFSGGQRQRIGIARTLAVEPRLIVCDEPVSALDVSVQAQIINLLKDLQIERGLAYLFIAHDLAVVEHISDRIAVMYLGRIVEEGPSRQVCSAPKHPYTAALLSAASSATLGSQTERAVLQGEMPSALAPPDGCPFNPRCPIAEAICRSDPPILRETDTGHMAACHLAKGPLVEEFNSLDSN
jgi:oligopeptide/dipeptide ABC transporter ATP-binding protein